MKHCLIIMHSFGGGAEFATLTLAANLDRRLFSPVIVSIKHLPALQKAVPESIPFIMPSDSSFTERLKTLFALRTMTKNFDLVIGSLELQSILLSALFAPGKAIGWLHKDLHPYFTSQPRWYTRLYTQLFRWAIKKCTAVVCVSPGVAASLKSIIPECTDKAKYINNPVDLESITVASTSPLPESLERCFSLPVLLGVGRLAPEKAFQDLIEAHALIKKRNGPKHNLCIVGEGPERPFLEATAHNLGVADSVYLPGFMNPFPAMKRASVLGLSSRHEGFGLVLLEAMALGLPVVAVDCPSGPSFLLDKGEYGILVAPDKHTAFTDALERMLFCDVGAHFACAGKERAEMFSLEKTMQQWQQFLLEH